MFTPIELFCLSYLHERYPYFDWFFSGADIRSWNCVGKFQNGWREAFYFQLDDVCSQYDPNCSEYEVAQSVCRKCCKGRVPETSFAFISLVIWQKVRRALAGQGQRDWLLAIHALSYQFLMQKVKIASPELGLTLPTDVSSAKVLQGVLCYLSCQKQARDPRAAKEVQFLALMLTINYNVPGRV